MSGDERCSCEPRARPSTTSGSRGYTRITKVGPRKGDNARRGCGAAGQQLTQGGFPHRFIDLGSDVRPAAREDEHWLQAAGTQTVSVICFLIINGLAQLPV
jgi:hypothetical protein